MIRMALWNFVKYCVGTLVLFAVGLVTLYLILG